MTLLGMTRTCALVMLGGALSLSEATAAPPTPSPSPSFELRVEQGLLTVSVDQVPLATVLRALSREVPFELSLKGAAASEPVSVRLAQVPVVQGLHRILAGLDHAIVHGGASSADAAAGRARVREVLVFSEGPDTYSEVVAALPTLPEPPRQREPSVADLKRDAVGAASPTDRALALEQLRYLAEPGQIVPTLAQALDDQHASIRELALELLEDAEGPFPLESVRRVALHDSDPRLRARALSLLAFRSDANAVGTLTQALQDRDERVRQLATELLAELGRGDRTVEPEALQEPAGGSP